LRFLWNFPGCPEDSLHEYLSSVLWKLRPGFLGTKSSQNHAMSLASIICAKVFRLRHDVTYRHAEKRIECKNFAEHEVAQTDEAN
jgi:hypothetical protein